jgi:ADP-heptose:LPS heptosyltransferase
MRTVVFKKLDRLIGPAAVWMLPRPSFRQPEHMGRILVIRPGGIGDAVLLLPLLTALKTVHRSARITVLAERRNGAVFSLSESVSDLLLYDRPYDLLKAVRDTYDAVIDTEQWHHLSAVIARMTGAPMLIGFATNDRARMFTHPVAYSQDDHEYASFMRLFRPLSIGGDAQLEMPFVQVADQHLAMADRLLSRSAFGQFVALFPGGSIPERRWGASRFHDVARYLMSRGYGIAVVGGKEDVTAGGAIVNGIPGGLNLCGALSLPETAALLTRSALLITGDSGIMHLGYAVGTRVLALFGPGIEKKWAPRSPRVAILNKHLSCSPCTKFGYTPKCPRDTACMKGISTQDVVNSAMELLNKD